MFLIGAKKPMTLGDLERPLHTVSELFFGAHLKNLNEDSPTLPVAKM